MIEMAEEEDDAELDDIENLESKLGGGGGKSMVGRKRDKPSSKISLKYEDEDNVEREYEREDLDQIKPKM